MTGANLSSSFLLSLTTIDFILSSLTVFGNLLLLITILRDPLRCLRTPASLLIANLAFSDFLQGLVIGYSRAFMQCFMYLNNTAPSWIIAVVNMGGGAALVSGIWTVKAMAVDRHIAVTDPLHYREKVTERRVKVFIFLCWMSALTAPSLYMVVPSQRWAVFLLVGAHTHFTVPISVILFLYFQIFRSLARRRCELVRLAFSVSTINLRHTLERERKMALTSLTVLILFCVSFLPLYIKIHLLNFCKCPDSLSYTTFDFIVHTFLYFSSLLDPFVYAWRVPKFRRSLRMCIAPRARNAAIYPLTPSRN